MPVQTGGSSPEHTTFCRVLFLFKMADKLLIDFASMKRDPLFWNSVSRSFTSFQWVFLNHHFGFTQWREWQLSKKHALFKLRTLDVLQFQLLKDYNNFIAHPTYTCYIFSFQLCISINSRLRCQLVAYDSSSFQAVL